MFKNMISPKGVVVEVSTEQVAAMKGRGFKLTQKKVTSNTAKKPATKAPPKVKTPPKKDPPKVD